MGEGRVEGEPGGPPSIGSQSRTRLKRLSSSSSSRVAGLSVVRDGGQAAVSLTPDTDGTGSGSLLDSILSTLKKRSSDVWAADLISHHR